MNENNTARRAIKEDLKARDAIDFEHESVGRLFGKMIVPTLIGMVSLVVLNITDGAFVGHGVGSDALAAVNVVGPLFVLCSGIGLMFGIGASIAASIHLGHGKRKAANLNITQGMWAAVGVASVIAAGVLTHLEATCRLFGATDALLPLAMGYMRWIALSAPLNIAGMVGSFAIRLDGRPKVVMWSTMGCSVVNCVLDYVLIYHVGIGLEGAAMATALSFGIGGVWVIVYLGRWGKTLKWVRVKLSLKSMALSLRNVGYHIKMGFSAMLGDAAIAVVMVVGNYGFGRMMAEDGVAAYSVACYCMPIVFMVGNAIVQSAQPIVSIAYAMQNRERMRRTLKISLGAGIVGGLVGLIVLGGGARIVAAIFLGTDCAAYGIAASGMPLYALGSVIVVVNLVIVGYLQSIERAGSATCITLLRGYVLVVPTFIVLPRIIGTAGLWLAIPVAEIMTLIPAVALLLAKGKTGVKRNLEMQKK